MGTMLALIAVVVSLAALFGLASERWLRLPTVVGTMLLTAGLSLLLALKSQFVPSAGGPQKPDFGLCGV